VADIVSPSSSLYHETLDGYSKCVSGENRDGGGRRSAKSEKENRCICSCWWKFEKMSGFFQFLLNFYWMKFCCFRFTITLMMKKTLCCFDGRKTVH